MRIKIHIKTGCKKEGIEKISEEEWVVRVRARPVEGAANESLIQMIAKEFGVAKSLVSIVSGLKSKSKIVEIE